MVVFSAARLEMLLAVRMKTAHRQLFFLRTETVMIKAIAEQFADAVITQN